MSLKSVCVYCEPIVPKWENFKHLIAILKSKGVDLERPRIECHWKLKRYEFDSLEDFDFFIGKSINSYYIFLHFKNGEELQLIRQRNIDGDDYQSITSNKIEDKVNIDEIMQVLGLVPEIPQVSGLRKSVFIAYHFDEVGQCCADKVSAFLKLLGFSVLTGRSYSPQPVNDKVSERMNQQDIVVAIHTAGGDNTWITQETALASRKQEKKDGDKKLPLLILKQKQADFKSGILADQEYIEFENTDVEKCFIQMLEGLKELGIKF